MPFKMDLWVATSTCSIADAKTCGDGTYSFNATSTSVTGIIAKTISSSTAATYPYNADDDEGGYVKENFSLAENDWLVVRMDWSSWGAIASSTDLTGGTAVGNTMVGNLQLNCVNR